VEQLRYLARTYFHQDYDIESPTPLGVLAAFRQGETPESVAELRGEIEGLLSRDLDEEALGNIWLKKCGSMYNPTYDGTTFHNWFSSMLSALR
jgi:hypothetical protein